MGLSAEPAAVDRMERLAPRAARRVRQGALAALSALLLASAGNSAPASAETGPALAVDGAAERHAISPYIYGLNFAEPGLAAELSLPIDRWGGNSTETYNFHLGADNTGSDWYYENIADCWSSAHNWCSGMSTNKVFAYREFVAQDETTGTSTLFTLPLAGYVASNAPVGHPFTCGFPASIFATQAAFDPYDSNCGNGVKEGSPLSSEPSRDGSAVGAGYDGEFVRDLVTRFGRASEGGVATYELGNEPGLWDSTHRDIHPNPTSYDELWEKSREAAVAVKAQDPSAAVLGFSEWGWPNYFCSAADGAPSDACTASSPDRAAHGGTPLVEWLLQQFHGYEAKSGQRLLDYIDGHYYAQGGSNTEVTRSLWDPTYTDPSWINANIDLIPRMHQWVATNYPGTKIALSEYNLSVSSEPAVNALIQADTLGIFAREGLDLATRWPLGQDGPLVDDAFRMYRNYDGAGGEFGDTWVSSSSADQRRLAVYGAQRSSDGAYTVMAINKTTNPLTSALSLSGVSPAGTAQVWQWTGGAITRQSDQAVGAGGFSATYPPRSITLLVLPSAIAGPSPPAGGSPPASPPGSAPTIALSPVPGGLGVPATGSAHKRASRGSALRCTRSKHSRRSKRRRHCVVPRRHKRPRPHRHP
jgi:hypothetical protein